MIRIDDRLFDAETMKAASERVVKTYSLRPDRSYAVCLRDTAEWLATFFALKEMGASVLPLHPATPRVSARERAARAGCDTLIFEAGSEAVDIGSQTVHRGALLQMSSGTTGAPKCVARKWQDVEREIATYVETFREPEGMTPVIACPTTHSYGLICGLLVGLERGAVPVVVGTDFPKPLLAQLDGIERPLLYSSPAMLNTLARLTPTDRPMHAVMTSGTLLPEAWFERLRARTTHLYQQYGCSEAGCIAVNPDMRESQEMGFVLPHHQMSDAGTPGAPAEIVIETAGQAVRTSDLGYKRADGMLVFVSRMDDTINVAGLNVYPQEVEDAAMAMPGVGDAIAFRKSDPVAGERVALVFSASMPIDARDLRAFCGRRLASHQLPMEIVQIREVPRQANGKVSRREVAALHAAGGLAAVTKDDFHDA